MLSPLQLLTVFLCGTAATVDASGFEVLDDDRGFVQRAPTKPATTLAVGAYFRPTGTQVSGVPGATTEYLRSPCPGLNSLANHGYLPRDGKNITPALIKKAIEDVYNVDPVLAAALTGPLNATFTLADLSVHNLIEHDASMVHADSYYEQDPAAIDHDLFTDFIGRGNDQGRIGVEEMGAFRKDLYEQCKAKPPGCDFGAGPQARAYGESALLLVVLGDRESESISVASAVSFLANERIPADYKKAATPVTAAEVNVTTVKIMQLAPAPLT